MDYFNSTLDSCTRSTVESVEMGSPQWDLTPGRDGYIYPPAQRCPPSPPVMAAPPRTAQASAPLARPSMPSAGPTAPTALAKSSYRSTTSSTPQSIKSSPYSHPSPSRGGSTTPSARLRTPLVCPPSPESHLKGGPASSWAIMPTGRAPDPNSARSVGLMAPSPAPTGVAKQSPSLARPSVPARSSPSSPLRSMGGEYGRVDGTLARFYRGGNAITELGHSFSADSVYSLSTHHSKGGSRRFMLALATLEYLGYKRSDLMYPVVSEIQFWYRRHSIRRYLERLTRRRRAATTIQCWKRRIWLSRWFAQQAQLRQKRHRLRLLCRGASAYARSVRGDRHPPPTPTEKSSDPKVFNHPFRSRGQPLPPRKMRRRHKRPRRRPGRRHRPRAPNSGGGPLCMPLCFWATQTVVAASVLFVGAPRSKFIPYLPPHTAATIIQRAYRSHCVDVWFDETTWRMQLSGARYELERNMTLAMRELQANRFVTPFGSVISYWLCHDNG